MSLDTRAPLPYRLSHIGARLSLELSPTGVPKDRCLAVAAELESLLGEDVRGLRTRDEVEEVTRSLVAWIARLRGGIDGLEPPAASTIVSEIAATTRRLICPLQPPLPIEIIGYILKSLLYSMDPSLAMTELRNCSQVHSSWRVPAQRLLFNSLRIPPGPNHCGRILAIFDNHPQLASYIRKAILCGLYPEDMPDMARLLSELVNLSVLVFEDMYLNVLDLSHCTNLEWLSFVDTSLPIEWPRLPSVKNLYISRCTYTDDRVISTASFPSLVAFESVGIDSESDWWEKEVEFVKRVSTLRCLSVEVTQDADTRDGLFDKWTDAFPELFNLRCLGIHVDGSSLNFGQLYRSLPPHLAYLRIEVEGSDLEFTAFGDSLLDAINRKCLPATLRTIAVEIDGYFFDDKEDVLETGFVTDDLLKACESQSISIISCKEPWKALELASKYGGRVEANM